MKRPIAAALISGLVFPGAGHLYLKRYGRGAALVAVSVISLSVVLSKMADQVMAVLGKVEAEGGTIDPSRISELASRAMVAADTPGLSIAIMVLIVCWVFGLVDAYRLGRR